MNLELKDITGSPEKILKHRTFDQMAESIEDIEEVQDNKSSYSKDLHTVGDSKIVKENDHGDLNKELYHPRPKNNYRRDIDYGLGLLTNNRVKDLSDLSDMSEGESPRRRDSDDNRNDYRERNNHSDSEDHSNDLRKNYIELSDNHRKNENKLDKSAFQFKSYDDDKSSLPYPGSYSPNKLFHDEQDTGMRINLENDQSKDSDGYESDKNPPRNRFMEWLNPSDVKSDKSVVPSEPDDIKPGVDHYSRKRSALKSIKRLEKKGYQPDKRVTANSSLKEVEEVLESLRDERALDLSIETQQGLLIGAAQSLEIANKIFNPLDFQLDGFTETTYENIGKYDEIFEELYEKYKDSITVSPEFKLIGTFLFSAISFHWSKVMMDKTKQSVPGFEQVMSNNPQLRREYQKAAAQLAGQHQSPGNSNYTPPPNQGPLGNIMRAMGGGDNPLANMFGLFSGSQGQPQQPQMPPRPQPPQGQAPRPQPPQGQTPMPPRPQPPQGQAPRPQPPQGQAPRPPQGQAPRPPQGQAPRPQPPQGQAPRPPQGQAPRPPPQGQAPRPPQGQPIHPRQGQPPQGQQPIHPRQGQPPQGQHSQMQRPQIPRTGLMPGQPRPPQPPSPPPPGSTPRRPGPRTRQSGPFKPPVQEREIAPPDDEEDILGNSSNRLEEDHSEGPSTIKSIQVTGGRRTKRDRRTTLF